MPIPEPHSNDNNKDNASAKSAAKMPANYDRFIAAIEHRYAVRQRAFRFHVAVHAFGREQLGLGRGNDRHGIVQVNSLNTEILSIHPIGPRQNLAQQFTARRILTG